jgi:hypothetical protein
MMRRMSRLTMFIGVLVLAFGVAGAAFAGKTKPPAAGDYEANLQLPTNQTQTYSLGEWAVAKDGNKRQIVGSSQYGGIYYPDPGKCDNFDTPLTATSVPISQNGKFHIKETDAVGGDTIKVDWKGKWKNATKVAGTIKLANGNCQSANTYTAAKLPGA